MVKPRVCPERRFWAKVNIAENDECWEWCGCVKHGCNEQYGQFKLDGRCRIAHRVSYELAYRIRLRRDQLLLHKCDNHLCVRPDHLTIGTQSQNMQDMYVRGRRKAKLTEDDVHRIRIMLNMGKSAPFIATLFAINVNSVYRIKHHHVWRHLK